MSKREQVIQFVNSNPGCRANDIAGALGMTVTNASSVASILARRDKISRRREYGLRYPNVGYWVYFPFGH